MRHGVPNFDVTKAEFEWINQVEYGTSEAEVRRRTDDRNKREMRTPEIVTEWIKKIRGPYTETEMRVREEMLQVRADGLKDVGLEICK